MSSARVAWIAGTVQVNVPAESRARPAATSFASEACEGLEVAEAGRGRW
jgi:hypothetical protein